MGTFDIIEQSLDRSEEELEGNMQSWAQLCWDVADAKGFHGETPKDGVVRDASPVERMMLIVSEVSEMMEAWRVDHNNTYIEVDGKPEGVAAELADVMIRCLDYAVIYDIPIGTVMMHKLRYNATRSFRHGGKVV